MRASATAHGLAQLTLVVLLLAVPCQGARPRDVDNSDGPPSPPQAPSSSRDSLHAGWLSPSWAYRVQITVPPDSIGGTGDLYGFTLLLPLEGEVLPGVFTHGNPDGSDLVVTRGDGTSLLAREVVTYDAQARFAELWFRADTLSRQANVFYLYYGNPDISIAPFDFEAWDPNYLGVYHFEGDPGSGILTDHGWYGHDAVPMNGWTSSDTTAGVIGQAWQLDGTHQWIDGDVLASADSSTTISAWLSISDPLTSGTDFALQSEQGYWNLSVKRNDQQRYPDLNNPHGFIIWDCDPQPDGRLHQFVWRMDGVQDTAQFFFDGEEQSIWLRYAPYAPHKVYTGNPIGGNVGVLGPCWGNPPDLFCGIVDELRAYRGVTSPEWIRTEYRNERSGSAFYTFSSEQSAGVPEPGPGARGVVTLRAYPNPAGTVASIRFRLDSTANGRLEILDPAGRLVRAFAFSTTEDGTVRQSWDARGMGDEVLPGGIYLVRAVSVDRVREGKIVLIR
jgi:hypothetical protein